MPKVLNKRTATLTELAHGIYVGRPSKWGNPYSHHVKTTAQYRVPDRETAVEKYRQWIEHHPTRDAFIEVVRRELKGKDLICWCAPQPCHADILLAIANEGR